MTETNRINSQELEEAIKHHVFSFRLRIENPAFEAPVILVVAGPPGTGKTTTIHDVCKRLGVPLRTVHGSDIVSQWEGQATALLEEAIVTSSRDESAFQTAVLIDDPEQGGLGVSENVVGTVSGEAARGFVMAYADDPSRMRLENGNQRAKVVRLFRPPVIFMTSNRLNALYPPMIRNRRANIHVLDPQGADKERIVRGMVGHLKPVEFRQLMRRYPDQSIAFFADTVSSVSRKLVLQCANMMKGDLRALDWHEVSQVILERSQTPTLAELIEAGDQAAGISRDTNFLAPPKPAEKKTTPTRRKPTKRRSTKATAHLNGSGRETPQTATAQ